MSAVLQYFCGIYVADFTAAVNRRRSRADMYIQHFGLAQYPFSLTPNTRYFLKLPSHQQAFDLLLAALDGENSFAKITGEVGTGKTMLCRKLLNSLEFHKNRFVTAYIPHPILGAEGMVHAIVEELGIERESNLSYYELLKVITAAIANFSREEKRVVLFIDEAQAMPEETLATVYLLANIETQNPNPLQVVLFGQPELDELLHRPMLGKIKRDLAFSFVLPALDRDGVETYVAHRLMKAGYSGPQLFTKKAVNLLFDGSQGIQRLINVLSHKALIVAFGKGVQIIDEKHMGDAIEDTESTRQKQSLARSLLKK